MGWWRIDPETGMPVPSGGENPEDAGACYAGDTPCDAVSYSVDDLQEVLGEDEEFSPEEAASLVFDRVVPDWVDPAKAADVLRVVDEMWAEVDGCYEEDWGRKARPPERRVAGEEAVRYLTEPDDD
jgi:hypothetical protein